MLYLAGSLFVVSGIVVGQRGILPLWLAIGMAVAALLVCIYFRQKQYLSYCFLFVFIGLAMIIRSTLALPPSTFQPQTLNNQKISLVGVVSNNPSNQSRSMNVIINQIVIQSPTQGMEWVGPIQMNVPLYTDIAYGDQVSVLGSFSATNPPKSSYQQYLLNHQIYGSISWPTIKVTSRGNGNPMLGVVYQVQLLCQQAVIRALPKDESGLLLGIVLGLQQPLSDKFSQALNATSTTHIIVASGYNATIIISTILGLTRMLKRRTSMAIALIALVGYVALSGFNPSIIRAAIMAAVAITAQLLGRQRLAIQLLFLTGLSMLCFNPWWIYDTSFQLSFAATIGIILIEPIISSKTGRLPAKIKEVVVTTVSAQLLTLPIIAITFGTISLFGMVANLSVLWIVPWVMLMGAFAIPLLLLFPWLHSVISWPVEVPLWYIKQTIEFSASVPLASASVQVSSLIGIAYYAALIMLVWRHSRAAIA